MPIRTQSADGVTHEFPDGTEQAVVDTAMKNYAAETKSSEAKKDPEFFDGFFDPITKPVAYAGKVAANVPHSAVEFAKNTAAPFLHPQQTAESFRDLGHGILQKMGIAKGTDYLKNVDALSEFFKERYGSVEAVKNTFETDPVGLAADLSTVLTGGGSAAVRAPGMLGRIGEAVRATGQAVNPLTAAGQAAKGAGAVGAELVGALGTHTGGEPLRIAFEAGMKGGPASKAYLDNLRGVAPSEETVKAARQAVFNLVEERGQAYRKEMTDLGANKTVLPFDKIDDALIEATKINTYKGIDLSPTTTAVRTQMAQAVQEWRRLPPHEFHTAEGLDALKRKLGDIYEATLPNTPERKVAGDIYRAVRQTIVDEAPEYRKIMGAYEEATDLIKQMEKTLSLNPKASVDTSLRKLQSVLRNNVSTSYGHRKELAEYLVKAGAPHLLERLAGQALQPWLPRGLGRLGAQIGLELGVIQGPIAKTALTAAPFLSPRVMGEVAHGAGQAGAVGAKLKPAANPAFQAGRVEQIEQPESLEQLVGKINQNQGGLQ